MLPLGNGRSTYRSTDGPVRLAVDAILIAEGAKYREQLASWTAEKKKTEMTTTEKELDQNMNFDWNRIQESGQQVKPLFGPGYTGLVNLGNRYYEHQSLKMAFAMAPSDPTVDLNAQLTGTFIAGVPKEKKQNFVLLTDALEFFLHFLDQVERGNAEKPELDPSRSFKFIIEERLQCPSGKVAYNKRSDYILSLTIPLHKATKGEQLEAFDKLKAEKKLEGKDIASGEIVRPRVPLEACLDCFSAPEEVHGFYSSALNAKTTAIKIPGQLTTWLFRTADVYIDVPDVIDITHMRSKGLQPGEELLPETGPCEVEPTHFVASEDIVSKLAAMGFNYVHCQKAAINTANAGVEEAMTWLLAHMNDSDIDDPISQNPHTMELQSVDETSVETLISFGFQEEVAKKALKASGGDIEKATDWIFNHPEASSSVDTELTSSGVQADDPAVPDGSGRYKLMALVSHMGTSTQCGHYVAHVYKDGRWVIFDDNKVGASIDPPKDMGYLYFFSRIDG
ncbi:hypothetical protein C4D60_Mb08t32660 [Musa balbisiana]|uniref:Ubiquitin carboxyl-terminal hydrolase 14 n=1 Tax=Musa balbisiana TaxID=52838 RepID=A0A4V4H9D3_MUSBA|nr:hypothetical protein C4D60_Mb08t32660 [Musa balbisiana]